MRVAGRRAPAAGAWALNLNVERELAAVRAGRGGGGAAARPAHVVRAAAALLPAGHRVLGDGTGQGTPGFAWCPTPLALEALRRGGCVLPPAPGVDVLVEANARETFFGAGGLPGEVLCGSRVELAEALGRPAPTRGPGAPGPPAWLVRPSLCGAGGDRLVAEGVTDEALAFAEARVAAGPLHVAPLVDVLEEFALHGRLEPDGARSLGRPVIQEARGGAWRRSAAGDVDPATASRLREAGEAVADRLHALGYFGPFGMDAFRWMDGRGAVHLHAPGEVNARYTMGFAVGCPELVALEHG